MEKRHLFNVNRRQEALQDSTLWLGSRSWWTGRHFARAWNRSLALAVQAGAAGRPSWDALVMFRALLLGVMHGLSDHQLQYMLLDRRSFKQFAGLVTEDQVPGSKDLVEVSGLAVEVRGLEELFLSSRISCWSAAIG